MRLGYFTMPVHPMHRKWSETLKEDQQAIILADQLGFHDAFMGEHLTDACENITNSMMFLATLIHDTKTIKLATGTTNLAQMHPVLIAVNAAMFDHLAQGRGAWQTVDLCQIDAPDVKAWMQQALRQRPIVGQQQHALGLPIQASDGKESVLDRF